ncbi:MAG: transcription antitermination factor NusB [Burkholderiaceae bacterium]
MNAPQNTGSGSQRQAGGRNARRRAREFAVQGLYEWLISASDSGVIEAGLRQSPGFERCDQDHLTSLLHGAIREVSHITEKFGKHLDRPIEQVSPVERAVLMVGTYEMIHHPEVPYRVVINEAVDLAKVFGGPEGHRFINGIMDKVASDSGVAQGLR